MEHTQLIIIKMNENNQLDVDILPPQKGLRRFRYRTAEAELADARESVRRWWWEYLRLSKDYWLLCKTTSNRLRPETQDEGLAHIYMRFGDVHASSFDDWWLDIGSRVFREQHEPPKVKEIQAHPENIARVGRGNILIKVPLSLSRVTIQRQISKILKKYEDQRPNNRLEISRSDFPINPVRYRLHTLQVMHEVYCLHRELITKPAALQTLAGTVDLRREWKQKYEKRADLYRIGKLLRISPSNERLSGEVDEIRAKQNRMRASVSRFLRRADQLIGNVEYGKFPVFTNHEKLEPRFTQRQLNQHKELEAEWWSLHLTSELTGDKVEAARALYYSEQGNDFA